MPDRILALLLGFGLDLLLGDPEWPYHPVRLIGRFIARTEARLRQRGGNLRLGGMWLAASTVGVSMLVAGGVVWLLGRWGRVPKLAGMALLDWMGLAATGMAREARGVARALDEGLDAARRRVARIVGRDTDALDEPAIIRATVETVAENTTDGVVSPLIWAALGGPALLWGFKAASTLDSMVGYRDERYRDIGRASAKLDDALNFVPARLAALLMCAAAWLAGLDGRNAWRILRRDHANHLSPNCAWTEAAAAGALHLQLGGTHDYFGKPVVKPTIGDDDRPPRRGDIRAACALLYITGGLAMGAIALAALLIR